MRRPQATGGFEIEYVHRCLSESRVFLCIDGRVRLRFVPLRLARCVDLMKRLGAGRVTNEKHVVVVAKNIFHQVDMATDAFDGVLQLLPRRKIESTGVALVAARTRSDFNHGDELHPFHRPTSLDSQPRGDYTAAFAGEDGPRDTS